MDRTAIRRSSRPRSSRRGIMPGELDVPDFNGVSISIGTIVVSRPVRVGNSKAVLERLGREAAA